MQAFLRESYIPSAHREAPSSGYIFSLPILSQLGIMLPRYLLLEGVSVDWTARINQLDLGKLKDHITQTPPIVLLVSGSSQDQQVRFGLFYPKGSVEEEEKPCIFQLEPVHRVLRTPSSKKENVSIQVDLDKNKNPILAASITWKRESSIAYEPDGEGSALIGRLAIEYDTMSLVVSEEGLGRFTVQRENYPKLDEHFRVDVVELLKCDHQRVFVGDFDY